MKVKAVKKYLEEGFPYLSINIFNSSILDLIKKEDLNLKAFDLIIVAVGDPALEFHLNKIFKGLELSSVFFSWLEPYDTGGHLLKVNYTLPGCYRCLYDFIEVDNTMELHNQSSFLAPGQSFEIDMEGCGTSFTPYGNNSVLRTSVLVVEQAINLLKGKEWEPELVSWKGSSDQVLERDYNISPRFNFTSENLKKGSRLFVREDCEVCHGT